MIVIEILQRRSARGRKILRQIFRNVLDDILLEWRRSPVKLAAHGIARHLHPFGNVGRKVPGLGGWGVPTLVFDGSQALFGPVLVDPPTGDAAIRLWHAVPAYPTVSEVWLPLLEAAGL